MKKPNIVLILADDLGYSDLGCYGGEIDTPNLDALAASGARLTSFYTTARCSPSRASLLTGVHPHQAGIGVLTGDDRPAGYAGDLSRSAATLAEILKSAGYVTSMAGKWHLSADVSQPTDSWPTRRGFDEFFGTLTGCGSYFSPGTLTRGESDASQETTDPDFFYTQAITDEAVAFVHEQSTAVPFFLYLAYTAPHWPLHALQEDIESYAGRFDDGWDELRKHRLERQRALGVVPAGTTLSTRDPENPAWEDVEDKGWETRRMEVYAAQVSELDRGVGELVQALKEKEQLDNTVIVFLSDNGASPEVIPHQDRSSFMARSDIFQRRTRDGQEVQLGSNPGIWPGAEDTYASYGRSWANLSNTPFRLYKKWTHEGGIAAPVIVHWPAGQVEAGRILDTPLQLVNVMPTLLEAAGLEHPGRPKDGATLPIEGSSFLPSLRGEDGKQEDALYFEHVGNAAIRRGRWKLVRLHQRPWELYDLSTDPVEEMDVSHKNAEIVRELADLWQAWSERVGVIPFERVVAAYESRGLTAVDAEG